MANVQSLSGTDLTNAILQKALQSSAVASPDSATAAASAKAPSAQEVQDRFLKLLVAQLNNQDPLNPLDNSQITSQMAQISTVSGIAQLNESMSTLAAAGAKTVFDGVGAIGRSVLVPGSKFTRAASTDGAVTAGFQLPASADTVKVEIVDANGQVAYTKQLGATPAGTQVFRWDATNAPAGAYTVKVTATANGQAVAATPLVSAAVLGVTQTSDGVRLQLSGQPSVAASDVKSII